MKSLQLLFGRITVFLSVVIILSVGAQAAEKSKNKNATALRAKTVNMPFKEPNEEKAAIFPQVGHGNVISAVDLSPDGKFAISGSYDAALCLWDLSTGKEIRSFSGHKAVVNAVAFSPNGKFILSGAGTSNQKDYDLKLWDIATGKQIRIFSGHTDWVSSVAFSPDGKYALSASGSYSWENAKDFSIRLWDVSSGKLVRTFLGNTDGVNSIAFSPNGRYVLSGGGSPSSKNNLMRLFDVSSGKQIRTFAGHKGVISTVAFSPNGNFVLSGGGGHNTTDYSLRLWDISSGKQVRSFTGHTNSVLSSKFTPDGRHIVSGGLDNIVRLWDIETGNQVRSFRGNKVRIYSVAVSFDGKSVLSGAGTLILWDIATGKEILEFKGDISRVNAVAYSSDGKFAVSGNNGNTLYLWDVVTGKKVWSFKGHTENINAVTFSPDGKFILSGSDDKTLRLWKVSTGEQLRVFSGHTGWVTTVDFSPDGKFVLSGSRSSAPFDIIDVSVRLWDVSTGEEIRSFTRHTQRINSVATYSYEGGTSYEAMNSVKSVKFSPDGKYVLSGGADFFSKNDSPANTRYVNTRLWDVATGDEIRAFAEHTGEVSSVCFSPDGMFALTGNYDKNMRLWDVSTGKQLRTFAGHSDNVSSVAFSPDGKYALSGSFDKTIRLWDVSTGRMIRIFTGLNDYVFSVTFSPDGKYALSGSDHGAIRIWDINSGKEISKMLAFKDDEWISISPEGYYNSSQNGHKHLNTRQGLKVYGIDQFYDVFYRPDILQAKLRGEDISPLISITIDDAIKNPPPTVKFTKTPSNTSATKTQVCYQATSTGGGIGEVRLFQNGKLVKSDGFYRENLAKATTEKRQLVAMNSRAIQDEMRGLVVKEKEKPTFIVSKPKGNAFEECVDLETVPGENEISVTAFNAGNTIQSYMQTTSFNSTRTPDDPHLYILSVGIDKYSDEKVNLKYAAKDAIDFIAKLPEKARGLYKPDNIHLETILDTQASRVGILQKIDELSARIKPGDSFILFVASHGVLVQDQYYIVTSDYDGNLYDTKKLISSNEIVEMSKKIKSLSQLFIFDTCHAGGVDNIISGLYDARMSVMAKKMGLHIYASAGSVQTAMDGYQGNGLYTHTLLKGIANGKDVDKEKSGKVTVKSLGLYSKEKTTEISTKLGHPQTPFIINFGRDNPLFAVK